MNILYEQKSDTKRIRYSKKFFFIYSILNVEYMLELMFVIVCCTAIQLNFYQIIDFIL